MGLLSDLIGLGLRTLASVAGEVAGTLTQKDGTGVPFTGARMTRGSATARGEINLQERALELPASGCAVQPHGGDLITITGESDSWRIVDLTPIAPGGTTIAWRLNLSTKSGRDDDLK